MSAMDLKQLITTQNIILYQQVVDGALLSVKENKGYRWFEYGGESIQSIMDKSDIKNILSPISQSLLLFLLFETKHHKVLNLGLGGASLERALVSIPNLHLTSVESSQPIIDIAKQFFKLPNKVEVVCQKAEQYVERSTKVFDVVLCDLFINDKSPNFLFTDKFYLQLKSITTSKAVVMINIYSQTSEQLLLALFAMKDHFPYIALIEFDDYANIVIICSSQQLPEKALLAQRLENFKSMAFTCLDKAINKMRYIPYNQN